MKYSIDTKVCKENGLSIQEMLTLLLVKSCDNIPALIDKMIERELLVKNELFDELLITRNWNDIMQTVLLDSEKEKEPEDRIKDLVEILREVFPTGRKEGTTQYWRGNRKEIAQKLKIFFKLHGKYSDEDIVAAAKSYVASFNGQYRHMRLLKYFIIKNEVQKDGEGIGRVVEISDLASYIENAGDLEQFKDEWTTTIN